MLLVLVVGWVAAGVYLTGQQGFSLTGLHPVLGDDALTGL